MFDIKTTVDDYISMVLTHQCNKNCPFCVDRYRGRTEYISLENVQKAIDFAKTTGTINTFLLVGGEPTLHPDVIKIAEMIKKSGFTTVMTTNYSRPDIVKALDKYIDSFNISYYNQPNLPDQKDFTADLTLSTLLYKGRIDSKEKLDKFISEYSDKYHLKFATLTICNDWTQQHQESKWLDNLDAQKVVLFNVVEGLIYRGAIIGRNDKHVNPNPKHSYKCQVDGLINQSWTRPNIIENISNQKTL